MDLLMCPETKQGHGSELCFKQQTSLSVQDDDMSSPKTMPLPKEQLLMRSSSLTYPRQEQMLSSASNKSDVTFPPSHPHYARNAGYGCGSLNANMHGSYAVARGPFTPSQWIELEHQALIYKYLNANAPVPSNLLIPLRKALYPYGYSGCTDPEPERCCRTDGKKWRCSRDAVADQKYCEKHINRGRHRSRKPVEGQTGHGASRRENSKEVTPPVSQFRSVVYRIRNSKVWSSSLLLLLLPDPILL